MRNYNFLRKYHYATFSFLLLFSLVQNYVTGQQKSGMSKGYGKASYNVKQTGQPVQVSSNSSEPADALQEKAFKDDKITSIKMDGATMASGATINSQKLEWKLYTSKEDIIDLDSFYHDKDYVYAYALAEVNSPDSRNVFLGVGSDDGIKIWHNGTLVHDNWIPRGIVKDNDCVPIKLVKGGNQILFKIQDINGGWGFIARLLDKKGLTEQLNNAAASGDMEKLNLLIEGGANLNAMGPNGINPVIAAKIHGRENVVQALMQHGAVDTPVPSPEKLADDYYQSLKGKMVPGIAVLVARDGKVLYRKGFGYADIKNKIQITPETKFRIGSVTKQFTAAAILKLQENSMINVNDKLSKFIPDFPRGDEVTIHQLLTHTSGIHSYTNNDDFIASVTKTISPDSLIDIIKKGTYDFNPGEKWLYNNSGYFILGYLVSKISGMPYSEYLDKNFFEPFGMNNTGVHYAGIKLDHEARGYSGQNGNYTDAVDWDMSWAGGAGALYSTVDDLMKWNDALYGGKVLNKQSLDAMLTPVVLNSGEKALPLYGYGLGLTTYRGEDVISHSGGLHGFVTQLAYYPKEKLSVVMFYNDDAPEVNFNPNKIAEAFLWNKMDKQTTYEESLEKPADLEAYVGRYDLSGFAVVTISSENEKLYSQISGQAKYEIFPKAGAKDEFFWKIVEARIKFFKDEKGNVSKAILFQNGQEINAKKLPEENIVKITPAILDNYIGKYQFKPGIEIVVTKETDKLYAQPTGQSKLELEPVSETDFIIKEINAHLSFVKDDSGKVNKIKLDLNGVKSELPRID